MNVLLLTDEMHPSGTARHIVDLANGLHEAGAVVVVASTDGAFRRQLHEAIPFIPLRLIGTTSSRKPMHGFIGAVTSLYRVVRRYDIQVIHSHKRYTDMLGRIVARLTGKVHVSTCHNIFTNNKRLSPFGDLTIACSHVVFDQLVRFFGVPPGRISMVYSGCRPFMRYDEDECIAVRKALSLAPRVRLIASVGHFTTAKDRETLIRAISLIKGVVRRQNALLAIVGEGKEQDRMWKIVESDDLKDIVRFYPARTHVEGVMNVAEFLVLSSVQEGLPYVLLEAASLSKPHIATSVGGVPEFVLHDETGLLVPAKNSEALGEAIERLLIRPEQTKKLGDNAYQRFVEFHSMKRFITDTLLVYERALKR